MSRRQLAGHSNTMAFTRVDRPARCPAVEPAPIPLRRYSAEGASYRLPDASARLDTARFLDRQTQRTLSAKHFASLAGSGAAY